jgi:hypothetical protein
MVKQESVDDRRWSVFGDLTAKDQRNFSRYSGWLVLWLAVWVAVRVAMEGWPPAQGGPLSWVLIAAAVAPGLVTVAAYMRFLREADELVRSIHLEALALGFGAGALFMLAWRLVEKAGGPALDVNDPLLVMVLVWLLGQALVARRYR